MTQQEFFDVLCYVSSYVEKFLRRWPGSEVVEIVLHDQVSAAVYSELHRHE